MSLKNRKKMYNMLVAAGRQKDICESLQKEFGNTEKVKVSEKTVTHLPDQPANPGRVSNKKVQKDK